MSEPTQPPSAPGFTSEDFEAATTQVDQDMAAQAALYPNQIGAEPVSQTWIITGIRCPNGEQRYEAGPEAKADGTEAYLSLPDNCVEDERILSDIWLADPKVQRMPAEAVPAPRHVPLRVWQERGGEISWRCSCGLFVKHQRLYPVGPTDLVCPDNLEHEPEVVAERYKADLVADIRTRIAHAMTVTGADVLRYIEHGTWSAPLHSEHRECKTCGHFHLCNYAGLCHTCERGGTCLG